MEKTLGALPVVADFCRKLKIAEVVDALCPVGDLAELTHGQVIEVLVANRLTSPAPLVHVADWAQAWAVGEAFGVDPGLLNDDRIGRALDAIAPHLDRLGAGATGGLRHPVVTDRRSGRRTAPSRRGCRRPLPIHGGRSISVLTL